jgi:hypothetical protein
VVRQLVRASLFCSSTLHATSLQCAAYVCVRVRVLCRRCSSRCVAQRPNTALLPDGQDRREEPRLQAKKNKKQTRRGRSQ